jgi:mono/diheme cytochrome c family protein
MLRRWRILILGSVLIGLLQWVPTAVASDPHASKEHGEELYKARCSLCHGPELKGIASIFPPLIGVTGRVPDADIKKQIKNGKGRMSPFSDLSDEDLDSLILFLKTRTVDPSTTPSPQEQSK